MNRNLAIIGASYLQLPLIKKAKELGYTTHVFAWAAGDVGEYEADFFHPISITECSKITEKCREIGICGICSIATDLGNIAVNHVANELGLPGNSIACTMKSTNKYLMRQAFDQNGDPSPKCILVDEYSNLSELSLVYPVIVKPTDRSGSRGIFKLASREGLEKAVQAAFKESFEKKALIEEYVEGQEYSVEGISYHGIHHILAVTLKYTTGAPHFIETGHMEPAPISREVYARVVNVITHALDTLEIKNSASHSEIKIDESGTIKIIEIGSRMGGDCIGSDLVEYSTGVDYLKAVIDVACGNEPDLSIHGDLCEPEVRFILNKSDLNEFIRIKTEQPDRILRIVDDKHLDLLGKTTDSSNRAGCYIIKRK
ncbi:ATP-grasp domain-containing protein [Butyrivibrio sp. FCS006]|uniref:ATP-grasp domain-containing protein n=1 Tax=Butyrivibrio sp. FCS006 TaxID=1280684 RepID=UPI000402A1D4|nr:ATP-grasp domain-containing protein [Butyrivibrio sp. FCS006]